MARGPKIESLREVAAGDGAVPRMELAAWAERFGLVAGLTTRLQDFSLGLWSEESVGRVMGRWRAFRAAFAGRFPAVVLSHQIHGNAVAWHEGIPPGWLILDGFDAHATASRGLLLTITVADCIPVYAALPGQAVALVHAGWRGVEKRALTQAIETLVGRLRCQVADIVIHCGVGICGRCYEVGSEVAEKLLEAPSEPKVNVDLRSLLADEAERLGIRHISVSPWCSAHDRDRFYSHRASGGRDGRMLAYLGIPSGGMPSSLVA